MLAVPWGDQIAPYVLVGLPIAGAIGWCLRERSRRKTLREVLPELRQADPATIREIGRLLIPARFQIQQRPSPQQEVPRPPPHDQVEPPDQGRVLGDLAQLQTEGQPGDHREPGAARG